MKFPLPARKCDSSTKSISHWRQNFTHSGRAHWSVEHAKREYNIRPEDTHAREGEEAGECCPRREFNFCLAFGTQIFLYRVRKSDSDSVMVTGVAISFAVCRGLHKLGKCLKERETPLLRVRLINLL